MKKWNTTENPNWCPGCGNWSILVAFKKALEELGKKTHEVVLVSGIGCGSKIPHWVNTYGFHTIHGRPLPVAQGIKLANHKLEVVAIGGDGDGYGIGLNHLMHIMRRNFDITYIVQNNGVYGLTKGQTAPTSLKGYKSKSTPYGTVEDPVNPLRTAIAGGATFVARGFSKEIAHLTELIKKAIKHRGFALVDVLQPCVAFNNVNTYQYYSDRVYKLGKKYDPTKKVKAFKKAGEFEKKIPLGVLYERDEESYIEQLPQLKKKTLVSGNMDVDISSLEEEYR